MQNIPLSKALKKELPGREGKCFRKNCSIEKDDPRFLFGSRRCCDNCAVEISIEEHKRRSQGKKVIKAPPEMSESIRGWLYGIGSPNQGNKQVSGANS